jgi:predicted NUDIX family NTP pyrophosphohydrolase
MAVISAGILLYRTEPEHEVLIAHMGGPFWSRKDAGAWSIPKGELETQRSASSARSWVWIRRPARTSNWAHSG